MALTCFPPFAELTKAFTTLLTLYCCLCTCLCVCLTPTHTQGGNDYEIFMSEKTVGHTVTSPADTQQQCTELFIKQ